MAIAKNQKFEVLTIHRSQIKNASYNPRYIVDGAFNRLKKGLKKFGLVETLVWNKRTGNLVSGHQRLKAMDELENSQDYELQVSAIDISLKEEMELNVQLNNPSMQGEFDVDALVEMANMGADVEEMGFSESDIDIMFGDSELMQMFKDTSEVDETKNTLRDIKKNREEYQKQAKEDNSAAYYFTVICEDAEQREELFNKMGVPFSEEFISAEMLKRL